MKIGFYCWILQWIYHRLHLWQTTAKQNRPIQNYLLKSRFYSCYSYNLDTELENTLDIGSTASKTPLQFVRIEEKWLEALKTFKTVCQLCWKPGHSAHRCFKRFNKEFNPPSQQTSEKKVKHALRALQPSDMDISQWLPDSGAWFHDWQHRYLWSVLYLYLFDVVLIGSGK